MLARHPDFRIVTAGLVALMMALLLALVPSLPEIDLSSSGGSTTAAPSLAAPAASVGTTGEPRWVAAPLTPPSF
jgi:hypothetical protein